MVKLGDLIKITGSKTNWSYSMDEYIGRIVRVRNVRKIHGETYISFDGGSNWAWCYEAGHFKVVTFKKYHDLISKRSNKKKF